MGFGVGAVVGTTVGVPDSGPHLASAKACVNSYWNFEELVRLVVWKLSTAGFCASVTCIEYVTSTWPSAQTEVGDVDGAPVGEIVGECVSPSAVGAGVGDTVGVKDG